MVVETAKPCAFATEETHLGTQSIDLTAYVPKRRTRQVTGTAQITSAAAGQTQAIAQSVEFTAGKASVPLSVLEDLRHRLQIAAQRTDIAASTRGAAVHATDRGREAAEGPAHPIGVTLTQRTEPLGDPLVCGGGGETPGLAT